MVKKRTVLYLRTDICPTELKAGGSVTHTTGVINGFLQLGYSIICASSSMPTILKTLNMKHFIELKTYPLFFFLRWKLNYLRWQLECFSASFFFLYQIKKLPTHSKFDFIYQRYSLLNFTGLLLKKWKKIPLILEYNGSEVWAYNNWSDSKHWLNINFIARFVERINVEQADYIIVVSEALKDELKIKKINTNKILVNPNGVDIDKFDPELLYDKRKQIRSSLGIDEQFVFGFCGTFSYWHGIDVLIRAIPSILSNKPNVHFLLMGDGPLSTMIKHDLPDYIDQKKITLTGIINPDQIPDYLSACDAFLSPTKPNSDGSPFFGSPTKIFEYLSMAKPIIASNLGQITELLSPSFIGIEDCIHEPTNQIGILISPNDHNALINAAYALIGIPDSKKAIMGKNARSKAHLFTWQQHVAKIDHFINNIQ